MTHEDERQLLYDNWTKRLAIVTVVVACTLYAYAAGQHSQFKLVVRSHENATVATRILTVCTERMGRAMTEVERTDSMLYRLLRELPPVVWVAP